MNIALIGYGKMGRMVEDVCREQGDIRIAGIVDAGHLPSLVNVPSPDVAVDFSHPDNLQPLLATAIERQIPLVLGTTGLSQAQEESIREAARRIAVVRAQNFSVGVTVMRRIAAEMAAALGEGFDIEIVETHHSQKADAPSGTAKMLLRAVDPRGEYEVCCGREGMTGARGREIGMHSLRGGTAAGEHSVRFFGDQEELELRHRADSRRIFASGAVKAARFVWQRPAGIYDMDDVLFGGR